MIKLMKSSFYHEAETKARLVEFIIGAEILSMNSECKKFEESFSLKQDRKYSIFVGNGSVANLILIQAVLNLGLLKKGDKVGVSSLTWATNIMPIMQLGLEPVMIDCNIKTLNISPETLQKEIGNIKCLFLTNVLGFSDKINEIAQMCSENGVLFLEDNCESLGSKTDGKLLGNFGLASTFSFFVGHHMSTIEGGMICTDDKDLADALMMARAHGWDRNLDSEKQKQLRSDAGVDDFHARYTFYDLAFNGRPTEINGFIGNEQIKYLDEIIEKRVNNFHKFQTAIEQNDDFIALDVKFMDTVSNFSMPLLCKDEETFKRYCKKFQDGEVEIRPVIAGDMTKQPFYKKYMNSKECESAAFIHKCGFYFGNNPELTEDEISHILQLLKK